MISVKDLREECKESFELRRDFDTEWKLVQKFNAPGKGCFDFGLTQPSKFQVTNKFVVNPIAKEASSIMVAGIYSWLSSSVRPWFKLGLPQESPLYGDRFIETELENRQRIIYQELAKSNFYTQRHRGYGELIDFGNSCMFVGSAPEGSRANLYFDSLITGEYTVSRNTGREIDTVFRYAFFTPKKLKQMFGPGKLPEKIRDEAKAPAKRSSVYYTVIHAVYTEPFRDRPVTSVYFLYSGAEDEDQALSISGYHEFPFMGVAWNQMHPHEYGLGPGSDALPEVMRLQEMEKSSLMAVHKSVDPPMLLPSKYKGAIKTLPSAKNYVANPKDQANPLYNGQLNIAAAEMTIERVEKRIQRIYMNDIFITAVRDPNASPMKAAEVFAKEREGMFKVGPVVEAICSNDLVPTIRRCYGVLKRAGKFRELPPDVEDIIEAADVGITSNLALIQKAITAQPLQNLLSTVAAMMQFEPATRHKIDSFKTVDEAADIYGAPESILISTEDAMKKAQAEAEAAQKQKEEERQAALQGQQAQTMQAQSMAAKNFGEAGVAMQDTLGEAASGAGGYL